MLTWRRKLAFTVAAMAMCATALLLVQLAADLYVHRKFSNAGGLNTDGYRGPLAGRKRPGEVRIVVIGGSTTLGFGVRPAEAIPPVLEGLLNAPQPGGASGPRVSVVNLGYNGAGARQFRHTLEDYAALDYDIVVFYTGYNDIAFTERFEMENHDDGRRSSAIYRWFGYYPMLPLVMKEKAMAIRYGGQLDAAYEGGRPVFTPNTVQRSQAALLEAMARIGSQVDAVSGAATNVSQSWRVVEPRAVECAQYAGYCAALDVAVRYGVDRKKRVLIAGQPWINRGHREQQELMTAFLEKRFPDRREVRFTDLGPDIDLKDPALDRDGMHLTVRGNRVAAERLAEPLRQWLGEMAITTDAPKESAAADAAAALRTPPPASPVGAASSRHAGETRVSGHDERPQAWVPAGTARIGSPHTEAQRDPDEHLHEVPIAGFWMDVTEVTNAEYARFLRAVPQWSPAEINRVGMTYMGRYLPGWTKGAPAPDQVDRPVTGVPWYTAVAYCDWAGKRLPTEAEWEYAARAGTTSASWWGNELSAAASSGETRTNPWGLMDMLGSVWEWTSSIYRPYPYQAADGREDPEICGWTRRVLRGGSSMARPDMLRAADRMNFNPRVASEYVGFRCAQDERVRR